MAKKKKYASQMGKYEGEQYRGGRTEGKKNLVKVDGGYKNQHGVKFTEEQKKALDRAVDRSNYQRKKQIADIDNRNPNKSQLRLMGQESDFIISRQSKSLQQFKSMEDYDRYMEKQSRIQSGEYLDDKTRAYKRNYMKAIDNVLDDEGIKMKIRMMKPEEFRKMVEEKGDDMEISYIYDPAAKNAKQNRIRELLGMKSVEEPIEDI